MEEPAFIQREYEALYGFGIPSVAYQGCAKGLKKRGFDSKDASGNNFLGHCK